MHHRRIASFLIGLWMAGSVLALYAATGAISGVNVILAGASPEAAKIIVKMPAGAAQALLRYHAFEQAHAFISTWEIAQLVLGVLLVAVLYLGTHVNRLLVVLCGLMILLVVFLHFVITPEIAFISRGLDLTSTGSGGHKRLTVLYGLYGGLELLKFGAAAIVLGYLFVFKTRTRTRSANSGAPATVFSTVDR